MGSASMMDPRPRWEDLHPQSDCEVFVGKISCSIYECKLVPTIETLGRIYDLCLLTDFDGKNCGYASMMQCQKHEAKRAVRETNNYEICPSRLLGVCCSVDNCRLFIGGIPKMKKHGEILEEIAKVPEGVLNVTVYDSAADKMKNRGFAFVEYESLVSQQWHVASSCQVLSNWGPQDCCGLGRA